jgi:hypothetical protein
VSDTPSNLTSAPRPFSLMLVVAFSCLTGIVALLSARAGASGHASATDIANLLPNAVTGLASLVGTAGYFARRRWCVPVYAVAVLGHFYSHAQALSLHGTGGGARLLGLALVPVLSLAALGAMLRHYRAGLLS